MPTVFRLPDIGEGLTEAEVVEWHAAVGDEVRADQVLVTVETDKAQADLPAPVAGVLLHQGAAPGVVLPVGEVLAVIGIRGERWSGPVVPVAPLEQDALPLDPPAGAEPEPEPEPERPPLVGTLDESAEDLDAEPPGSNVTEAPPAEVPPAKKEAVLQSVRPRALPLVRREAAARGIDLSEIAGSGPGGRVIRADLDRVETDPGSEAAPEVPAPEPEADAEVPEPAPDIEPGENRIRMSATRRTIAARLTESWRTIPHVTTFGEFDAGRLLDVRRALAERHRTDVPLDALLVGACLPVLGAHPELNATLDGDELVLHERADVGVAIDGPSGLLVGVVRDAGTHDVIGLSETVLDLAERARARRLAPDDMSGQTFTVSNIGAVGGGMGTPIIPLGTTAILSVGRAEPKPVVRDGGVTVATIASLSLSYDHRVIDGAQGRAVMSMLVENLEEPALFLV